MTRAYCRAAAVGGRRWRRTLRTPRCGGACRGRGVCRVVYAAAVGGVQFSRHIDIGRGPRHWSGGPLTQQIGCCGHSKHTSGGVGIITYLPILYQSLWLTRPSSKSKSKAHHSPSVQPPVHGSGPVVDTITRLNQSLRLSLPSVQPPALMCAPPRALALLPRGTRGGGGTHEFGPQPGAYTRPLFSST